ncbi:MAG TPA: type II toxin-antitoxin system prevent-host-death family antitoxin [Gaiellaceae bacterium]
MDAKVTVRELRQNLSVHLRRVERGETLEVTRRGEPVAVLAPLPGGRSAVDRAVAELGASRPAGDLLDHGAPLPRRPGERPLSELVAEQREELLGRR